MHTATRETILLVAGLWAAGTTLFDLSPTARPPAASLAATPLAGPTVPAAEGRERTLSDLARGDGFAVLAAADLAESGVTEAIPALIRLAAANPGAEPTARIAAIHALATLGGDAARLALEELVAAPGSGDLRYYAARALVKIGTSHSMEALRRGARLTENVLQDEAIQDALLAAAQRHALIS